MFIWSLVVNSETESYENSDQKGPQEVSRWTSCSDMTQLWDQTKLLRAIADESWKPPRKETVQSPCAICATAGLVWGKCFTSHPLWISLFSKSAVPRPPTMHSYEQPRSISLMLCPKVAAAAVESSQNHSFSSLNQPRSPTLPAVQALLLLSLWLSHAGIALLCQYLSYIVSETKIRLSCQRCL